MPRTRAAAWYGALATVAVLGGLSGVVGLRASGWLVGLAAGWTVTAAITSARARDADRPTVLPPDWVTLSRAILIAGVAALVADALGRQPPVTTLVTLASVALVLDAVDGQVARRTHTATALGRRFDGEVDAFLILVLSIQVGQSYGSWVLLIGAARYALLVCGWLVPWLAAPLPDRYWRKVIAAIQGIVLTVAASGLVSRPVGMTAVAGALALLAASFGHDIWWLYRAGAGRLARRTVRWGTTVVPVAFVWAVLVAPDRLERLTPAGFVRIPAEGLVLLAAALALPGRARQVTAVLTGAVFGLLAVVKVFDVGFYQELGRPFDPMLDWGNLHPAIGVARDSLGGLATDLLLVGLVLGLMLLVAAVTVSTLRITSAAARHRRRSLGVLGLFVTTWLLCASLSVALLPDTPIASSSTAALAVAQVRDAQSAVRDQQRFLQAIHEPDPEAQRPAATLLNALRGKDIVIAFVESYGQVAVEGTSFSTGVDAVLQASTASLAAQGWSARSAWLTSPTFGGISWLAHSTLQSGLWVDNQRRYDQIVASSRFNLTTAFHQAGWRTVSDGPSDEYSWPPGASFYHYDQVYDRRNVGYHGPTFSYASMPDQYTLAAFQRLELAPHHKPVMAEIDLVSSHTPWAPLPTMVPWRQVGDGSVFDPMPGRDESPATVWRSASSVRQYYARSVEYSLQALTSWVTELDDPDLVLVLLGDHQPATTVSGPGADHDVPISIVARDPSVLGLIAPWRWTPGLQPAPGAPLERMDAFRNRFLDTFSAIG